MKKRTWIVIAVLGAMLLLMAWVYYDFKYNPTYIPGRDTVAYWNEGVCQILRSSISDTYHVYLNKTFILDYSDSVIAYREIGSEVYFITTKGGIVVDLATNTYTEYDGTEPIDANHIQGFVETDAYTYLEKIN